MIANEQFFELVSSAKILGVTVTDDLTWNAHVNNIVLKASKRLYLLRLLKRADLDVKSLIQFYCTKVWQESLARICLPDFPLKPTTVFVR